MGSCPTQGMRDRRNRTLFESFCTKVSETVLQLSLCINCTSALLSFAPGLLVHSKQPRKQYTVTTKGEDIPTETCQPQSGPRPPSYVPDLFFPFPGRSRSLTPDRSPGRRKTQNLFRLSLPSSKGGGGGRMDVLQSIPLSANLETLDSYWRSILLLSSSRPYLLLILSKKQRLNRDGERNV